jgi:hypothetical protein
MICAFPHEPLLCDKRHIDALARLPKFFTENALKDIAAAVEKELPSAGG